MDYPTIIAITEDKLDLNALLEKITLPITGASAIFTGIVRGVTSRGKARETLYLEYEAYKPMAELKMRQIAEEIVRTLVGSLGLILAVPVTSLFAGWVAHRCDLATPT